MNKNNNTVDTAQKGQATKKDKTPVGKVTLMKETEARRKAREESYRNFRISALRRRCKRMGFDKEKTEELVKKLIEQMNAPKEYSILIMLAPADGAIMKEALAKANIKYKYHGDTYFSIDGDQAVLAKIREIAPGSAKIHPHAKKMESVIPKDIGEKKKTPTNNTAEKKAVAKAAKFKGRGSVRAIHRMQTGRLKNAGELKPIRTHSSEKFNKNGKLLSRRKPSPRPNAGTNKTKVKIGKRAWIKANNTQAVLSLAERIAKQKAITIQMKGKKASVDKKTTSTAMKQAA